MLYAKKTNRIQELPVFPTTEDFDVEEKPIQWLPEDRQIKIIEAIPETSPTDIFGGSSITFGVPAEACALHKSDFDGHVFIVQRTFSRGILHNRTKGKKVHYIPCVDAVSSPSLKLSGNLKGGCRVRSFSSTRTERQR